MSMRVIKDPGVCLPDRPRALSSQGRKVWIHHAGRATWHDERGIVGIEFALIMSALCFLLLNAVDVARYAWIRTQVENAAQVGAQAAWKTCDPSKLPVNPNCPTLATKVTAAVQSTSLGDKIQLQEAPSEGYYCLNTSNTLQYVGTAATPPANCAAAGRTDVLPGDYIRVDVTYPYKPLLGGLSVAGLLTTPITETALMRLQ
jgi:Flp pilus assembly protein TadG